MKPSKKRLKSINLAQKDRNKYLHSDLVDEITNNLADEISASIDNEIMQSIMNEQEKQRLANEIYDEYDKQSDRWRNK